MLSDADIRIAMGPRHPPLQRTKFSWTARPKRIRSLIRRSWARICRDLFTRNRSSDQARVWLVRQPRDTRLRQRASNCKDVLVLLPCRRLLLLARIRRGEFRIESPVVFLEIGGNETLGPTTLRQFEKDLDQPLAEVSSPGRQVMILELPLPPFYNGFGLAQRRLARKHNVLPVPRRSFLSVLAAEESTLDTIHLSGEGQRPMAACVWQLVRLAFSNQ